MPDSIELAGGPTRVLSLVAFDAASTGIQIHMTEPGAGGPEALRDILALIEAGRLRVPISGTYPLDEMAAAADRCRGSSAGPLRRGRPAVLRCYE
ncbi:zinc-binding dehydrogenase [Streptomyces shenzhenensis]